MTNKEVLTQLRKAESLVIEALRIMYAVGDACSELDNANSVKRRDRSDSKEACYQLFKLVEPNYVPDGPENLTVEIANAGAHAPRGLLGSYRLRYEILCGEREWVGGWNYPKVSHPITE